MNRRELHAAVCATPDQDAPRVAFAEFVAPYDPAYAELIKLQLARATHERARGAAFSAHAPREAELLRQHGEAWTRYMRSFLVPDPADPTDLGCGFERGFIGYARVAIENVVGLGAQLWQFAPIQHLDVAAGAADGPPARVLRVGELARLDSLSLAGLGLDDDDAIAIADCAALTRASWLDLSNNRIGRRGVEALARSPIMANKIRIELAGNPCDPVQRPALDFDGSVADVYSPGFPREIEAAVGKPVPWFYYRWGHVQEAPDRFHAKWFVTR